MAIFRLFPSFLALAALTLALLSSADAAVIHVPDEASTIQLGIAAATTNDTVLVAAGTYTGAGNTNIRFGGKDILVLGEDGYTQTIIDCAGGPGNDVRAFIFDTQESDQAALAGFTIRNGYRTGSAWPDGFGAGILIRGEYTNPTIKDCLFEDNYAEAGGGAFAVINLAEANILRCIFQYNTADLGGGAGFVQSPTTVIDCYFNHNTSVGGIGGGLYCYGTMGTVVRDTEFRKNEAGRGGGLACRDAALLVTECDFIKNTIHVESGSAVLLEQGSDTRLSYCVFIDNIVESTEGGTVACDESTAELDQCTLYQNAAPGGSGVYLEQSSSIQIDNTIIMGGFDGEAVWCDGTSSATLSCSDVFDNQGGDWVGCIADQAGLRDNLSADPLFCNPTQADFHLAYASPCAPAQTGSCGEIGRYGADCPPYAISPTTWGAIKASFK